MDTHHNFSVNVATTKSGQAYIITVISPDGMATSGTCLDLPGCWQFAEKTINSWKKDQQR
jgi:hypothetical protein